MARQPSYPAELIAHAIRMIQQGAWNQLEGARYIGCSEKHMSEIMGGTARRAIMATIDPSSCAPSYQAPTRRTTCPYCDHGNTWVKYEGTMDRLGNMIFRCPNCGSAAI